MSPSEPLLWLLDAVIAFTVLEGIALWLHHRFTGGGVAPRDYALNLVSGLFLMLTLRSALGGAPWPLSMVFLGVSGALHGLDLRQRWQKKRQRVPQT